MDTVEELNSTYFYAGRSNLTASQLLFMIFCENTANQLGVQDFGKRTARTVLTSTGYLEGSVTRH
ncbi:STM2901 family protein, partial [Salmonella sp. 741265055_HSA]